MISKNVKVTMSQVRKTLCKENLQSKVVTYYKKRKQENRVSQNILARSFQPGKKDIPTVVCDITKFRLINELKVYFGAALEVLVQKNEVNCK
ncbi:TPA: hypothetical protein QCO21_005381 [Bacillus cereus]|nr:hypothetical protein [Bacillus cereus]